MIIRLTKYSRSNWKGTISTGSSGRPRENDTTLVGWSATKPRSDLQNVGIYNSLQILLYFATICISFIKFNCLSRNWFCIFCSVVSSGWFNQFCSKLVQQFLWSQRKDSGEFLWTGNKPKSWTFSFLFARLAPAPTSINLVRTAVEQHFSTCSTLCMTNTSGT